MNSFSVLKENGMCKNKGERRRWRRIAFYDVEGSTYKAVWLCRARYVIYQPSVMFPFQNVQILLETQVSCWCRLLLLYGRSICCCPVVFLSTFSAHVIQSFLTYANYTIIWLTTNWVFLHYLSQACSLKKTGRDFYLLTFSHTKGFSIML